MSAPDRQVRARTRAGRLGALDRWLLLSEHETLANGGNAVVIDVGFGEHPATTVELRGALADFPGLRVVGLERDGDRVDLAQGSARENLTFEQGGFDQVAALGPAVLVRAMNVLRAYREDEVADIHAHLGAPLVEGGLVLEGTSDTEGHLAGAHVLRRRGGQLLRESVLLFTDFTQGFSPMMFRDWLPRDFRRRVRPGDPARVCFDAWAECWRQVRTAESTPALEFVNSIALLEKTHPGMVRDARHANLGYLCLYTRALEGT